MKIHRLPIAGALIALMWLAGCASSSIPSATRAKRYDIAQLGAVGDGKTTNTLAIQSAIDRCAAEGGGTVVVPKGTFLSGALFFKQGVDLLVEKDGVLKGSPNPNDYSQVNTRWEGIERLWTCAFLNFDNMTDVTLSGDGMIDGSGDLWMQRSGRGRGARGARGAAGGAAGEAAAAGARRGGPAPASAAGGGAAGTPRRGRPRMICISNSKNVRVAGLHLQRQAVWCLHFLYCENVLAEDLNIRAIELIPSSDGIDIDSCRRVLIRRCDIACNDDDIAIKCGKDEDGLRVNRPSEDITISDCTIGAGGGITMGSEVSGSIRRVVVERCTFTGSGQAVRFKSQPSRGGVVEDILYRDIKINNTRAALDFNLEWRMVPPVLPPAKVLTVVRNVRIVNLRGTAQTVGVIHGLAESPIRDVTFENCEITAGQNLRIENAEAIDVAGLVFHQAAGATAPVVQAAAPRAMN